jgi:hypothetical protein
MCYKLETFYNKNPLFTTVDATYIIHLKGNGRYENVKKQLQEYSFTEHVHIVMNEGYKKCHKPNINSPAKDLIDAYLYCIKDAEKYNTILILEDDFIVNKHIYEHIDSINTFVESHTHFIYRIGCYPYVMFPYDINNYRGISGGAHAVVYSKSVRTEIESYTIDQIDDWDVFLNQLSLNYIYYTPLVYQLLPETENQKKWGDYNFILFFFGKLFIYIIKILQLDKQIEPGYSILYTIAKSWIFLLCIYLIKINSNKK